MPILSVLHETLHVFGHSACSAVQNGIDGDAAYDEGNVVHYSADGSQNERHYIYIMYISVAPTPDAVHCSDFDEDVHAETYAEEEHNHLNQFILEAAICAGLKGLVAQDAFAVDDFVHHPKHAKHAKSAKERRQVREPVEGRYEPQTDDSEEEHQDLLPRFHVAIITSEHHHAAALQVEVSGKFPADEVGGDDSGEESGQDKCGCVVSGSDGSSRPNQQGCDVANDGEATAAVCGYHDDCAQEHPLPVIDHELVHHHQHHDCRSQVVQVGGESETAESEHRDDYPSATASAKFRDEVEASVVGQNIHNRHRRQQIHHHAGQLGDVAGKDFLPDELVDRLDAIVLTAKEFAEYAVVKCFDIVGAYADVEHPSPDSAKERHGGFVDAGNVFRADEQIAQQHQGNNSNSHGR